MVTGGPGYIGSSAAEMFRKDGNEISIFDELSPGHADSVSSGARFVQGSSLNLSDIADVLSGCIIVMHFAGKSLVAESMENPAHY